MTRIAWHEAGHCLVAHGLGNQLDGAHIRPGIHLGGLASHTTTLRPDDVDIDGVGLPAPLLPERLRRWVETRVCTALAGAEAEKVSLHLPPLNNEPVGRFVRTPVPTQLRDRWVEHDASRPPTDDETAFELVALLWDDPSLQTAHLEMCRAVARNLLERNVPTLTRVARALLEHRELSGDDLAALIEGTHDGNQDEAA